MDSKDNQQDSYGQIRGGKGQNKGSSDGIKNERNDLKKVSQIKLTQLGYHLDLCVLEDMIMARDKSKMILMFQQTGNRKKSLQDSQMPSRQLEYSNIQPGRKVTAREVDSAVTGIWCRLG